MSEEEVRIIVNGAAAAGTLNALETISVYLKTILDHAAKSANNYSAVDLLTIFQHALENHVKELKKYDGR